VGFHLRGDSEPWLLYVKGTPKPIGFLRNAWTAPRTNHSEKPMGPLCDAVSALCPRAGLVLDLFAGLAPMARACHATGRRYIGAEIDPDRHHQAMCRLALARE
jgi:DNA modification methylase